jgi:pilus assembly protein CpaE
MPKHRILVIDEDLRSRKFVAQVLRLLGHTAIEAGSGKEGLEAAWSQDPELIIADPLLSDVPGEQLASRLRADARSASIPLVALSKNARTARLRSWLDSGFDDYLVKSPDVVPVLQESIKELLGSGPRQARKGGLLIAFFSAKGGAGTTSICANLAACFPSIEPSSRVVVADLVLPMGSVAGIVGYEGEDDLESVSQIQAKNKTTELLRSRLRPINFWSFHLVAGCNDPERARALNFVRIGKVVSSLRAVYDYVILDVGRSLSRISMPVLEAADVVAIVATAEPDSVRLTKAAWEYLSAKGVKRESAFLILNRPTLSDVVSREEVEATIGLRVRTAIPNLREDLSLANRLHRPYVSKFPGDANSLTFMQTAQALIDAAKRSRQGGLGTTILPPAPASTG